MNLSFKHYYWRWIKNQLFLFVLMLAIMTIARLAFTFAFGDWAELQTQMGDLKAALLLGLRYDLMPLAYVNALPFILMNLSYLLPGKITIKATRLAVMSLLLLGYGAVTWLYICDYAFYSYFQDHLNILFFGFFEDDTIALLTSVWKNYNLPLWLSVIFFGHYVFFRLLKFLFSPFDFDLKTRKFDFRFIGCFLVGMVLIALCARGNFSRRPLSLEDAHISSNEFINELSLNGILTFNRAMKIRKTFGLNEVNYLKRYGFENWQAAFETAFDKKPLTENLIESLRVTTPVNPEVVKNPPHVVLIVMESFGTYWNNQHSDTFNILGSLEEHFKTGILFNNFLSAENGTIGSLVSVANAQVIRPGARFLSESDFMKTPLDIAGQLPYKKAGYDTHFLYGGKLGWRDLGKYLAVQGYDNLWGADEVKDAMPELNNIEARDLGNEWGIFDEYLYSFIEEQLRTATKPQFFMVLTTSNHPPFEFPSSYNTLPMEMSPEILKKVTVGKEIALKRFLGLQYANQKAGEFLSKIRSTALNDKVVVALTGDHSFWIAKGVGSDEEFKRFAVPFYLALPDRLQPKKINTNNFGSHEDIFPTLYNLTLSNQEYLKLGEDLINEEGMAQNSAGIIANQKGAYHHKAYWSWKTDAAMTLNETSENEELLKMKRKAESLIGLTDLYLKEEKSRKRSVSRSDRPAPASPSPQPPE
ncbi:MAG: sulfatase-like hydrolase/transferase [Bdellovibrionales bacterium]|nr:sulfatase-like hydrolase/transferase [Bdellovibrionales bacterium]